MIGKQGPVRAGKIHRGVLTPGGIKGFYRAVTHFYLGGGFQTELCIRIM